MSAPDPKEWEEPDDDPEILAFAYGIARRRALEELKALATQLLLMGLHHNGQHLKVIHDRIAAIEAEEPTPASPA